MLDKSALLILDVLEKNGYTAALVGGCVRDMLLGREVNDIDIASSASPEEIKKLFSGYTVVETGIKHGTVGIVIEKKQYEVTTYRAESAYSDGRHPDSVRYIKTIDSDLARRDFTVNAIAFSPKTGFIDPYGGIPDLEKRILRAVGSPDLRFAEDSLRILRGVRFMSVLGFDIEPETLKSMKKNRELLKNVAAERIFAELKKTLQGVNAVVAVSECFDMIVSSLMGYEGQSRERVVEVLQRCCDYAEVSVDFKNKYLMPAALLCGLQTEAALKTLSALKPDRKTKKIIMQILNEYNRAEAEPLPNKVLRLDRDTYLSALCLKNAGPEIREIKILIEQERYVHINDLKLDGRTLIESGCSEGKAVGDALKKLTVAVIEGRVKNGKKTLLKYFERYIK